MNIPPKQYGLPARTVLEQLDENTIAIVVNRKSRIIMADGRKILDKSGKIRHEQPLARVVLKTTAPVCSKTTKFLADEGIKILLFAADE